MPLPMISCLHSSDVRLSEGFRVLFQFEGEISFYDRE